ncbi:MAG: sigma-70 family RNA polymerase sigma factor [Planctomycetales bacterium]|nr:sigma-70 family RNA polymerase sigma factor [Planctomycetales bacterium]
MNAPSESVSAILATLARGEQSAAEALFPIVYGELRRLAERQMRSERVGHTLGPTALIHEAYLRLVGPDGAGGEYQNIEHFMATASIVMRRILVNHARAKKAAKRKGQQVALQLDELVASFDERAVDLVALDDALKKLESLDQTQFRLVEMRFFGGMTMEQCAVLLGISTRSAYYEWLHAKAWLKTQLGAS